MLNKNLFALLLILIAFTAPVNAAVTMDSDNRIKTMVYDENDVFTINAESGFQTDIELAPNESIDTLSIGDAYGWQVTPATHRIFVKPLQKSGVTNLSVITNKRTYQFELVAVAPGTNRNHVYVVKFYYPDMSNLAPAPIDRTRNSTRPISSTFVPEMPTPPGPSLHVGAPPQPAKPSASSNRYNYNYTLDGPETIAPNKIYDDGKSTYFEFKTVPQAQVTMSGPDGSEVPANARPNGQSGIVVNGVAQRFTIRDASGQIVHVYNEALKLPTIPSSRTR